MPDRGPTLTVRPWDLRDGDPARPDRVFGAVVARVLAARADAAGALVVLADGRVALTGAVAAVGRRSALLVYVRSRAREHDEGPDSEWLDQVSRILRAYPIAVGAARERLP